LERWRGGGERWRGGGERWRGGWDIVALQVQQALCEEQRFVGIGTGLRRTDSTHQAHTHKVSTITLRLCLLPLGDMMIMARVLVAHRGFFIMLKRKSGGIPQRRYRNAPAQRTMHRRFFFSTAKPNSNCVLKYETVGFTVYRRSDRLMTDVGFELTTPPKKKSKKRTKPDEHHPDFARCHQPYY